MPFIIFDPAHDTRSIGFFQLGDDGIRIQTAGALDGLRQNLDGFVGRRRTVAGLKGFAVVLFVFIVKFH